MIKMIKDIIIFGIMLLMLSIISVQAGVHIDYVGLGVMIILASCIIIVKFRTDLFWRYIDMRERHKKVNRRELRLD